MKALAAIVLAWGLCAIARSHPDSEPDNDRAPAPEAAAPAGPACEVSLRLADAESGRVLPGCVRVSADGGETWLDLPPLLPRMLGLSREKWELGWHVLTGESQIQLPRTEVRMEAFAGIETELVRRDLDLSGKETQEIGIDLKRLFDPSAKNWVAGNTHLHLRKLTRDEANRYLVEVSKADGLEVVFVSYLERALVDREYTSNAYTADDLARISEPGLVFGSGEEYRHNFGAGGEGYGHVMLLDLATRILPASVGPGITQKGTDGTPLRPAIRKARDQGATVIWCHNAFGLEDLPNWLAGHVDAQNIFDGGNRGSYEDTFYRYLNLGLRVPFSTGTDWFIYDFSRVYVPMEKPVTARRWLEALRSGRSVITNGVWLEFTVNGQGPGEVLEVGEKDELRINVRAKGRHDFGMLEFVINGSVAYSRAAVERDGHFWADIQGATLHAPGPMWLAVRIAPAEGVTNELGEPLFAHTSPVYVRVDGQDVRIPKVAAEIRAELEKSQRRIVEQARFLDEDEKEDVLKIYREAVERLDE